MRLAAPRHSHKKQQRERGAKQTRSGTGRRRRQRSKRFSSHETASLWLNTFVMGFDVCVGTSTSLLRLLRLRVRGAPPLYAQLGCAVRSGCAHRWYAHWKASPNTTFHLKSPFFSLFPSRQQAIGAATNRAVAEALPPACSYSTGLTLSASRNRGKPTASLGVRTPAVVHTHVAARSGFVSAKSMLLWWIPRTAKSRNSPSMQEPFVADQCIVTHY